MRVLRFYHDGRNPAHRERDRALVRAGAEVTLVVPRAWPGPGCGADLRREPFDVEELEVRRAGNINRHRYADPGALSALLERVRPDVVDVHEEPYSAVTRQVLRSVPAHQAVVGYTAQNLDKRYPPPFAQWERAALERLTGLYPCSRQAASVAVGKGFNGPVRLLGLAPHPAMTPGDQCITRGPLQLLVVGRLVPEKGVREAVDVLAALSQDGPTRLTVVGAGPELAAVRERAVELGVADRVRVHPWVGPEELAEHYRAAHLLLAPSRATSSWVEQFGRMVVEARACGTVAVAFDSGALPEVVGGAGMIVGEGDVAGLAGACRALREDPSRWAALRDAGLAARLSWDDVAAEQVALYDAALAVDPRGRTRRSGRAVARVTWGGPAVVRGQPRPFAAPFLRDDPPGAALLGRALDGVGALRGRR